jgi:hypothetical protein
MTRLPDRSGALAAVGLIACLVAWPGCSRKRGVEIYQDGEVTVVHNPETPSPAPGGPSQLILREDLVIGKGPGPDRELFDSLNGLGVDDEENIYAFDGTSVKIHVFDRNGRHLRSFGSRGQGPGELQDPGAMDVRGDGAVAVLDRSPRRVVFYDRQGRYLRSSISRTPWPHMGFEIDTRGAIYGVSLQKRELRTWRNRLFKYDEAMTSAEEIAGIEGPDPSDVISFFRPRLEFHLTRDDRLVWVNTSKYEFHVLDRGGREIRRIVKDFRPLRIPEDERRKRIQQDLEMTGGQPPEPGLKFEFPAAYPPVRKFLADEEGRIFVKTHENDGRGGDWWDAFDVEGRFVARFLFPEKELAVRLKKSKLYAQLEEGEDGSPLLKRYALDWK